MRRPGKLAAFVLLSLVTACGGSGKGPSTDESDSEESSEADRAEPPEVRAPATTADQGGKRSGWRWRGSRQDCFYVFKNECFAEKKSACRAAGCGLSRCISKEDTAPIKVRCRAE